MSPILYFLCISGFESRELRRRAAIGYLDVILVRQWEKFHEICSLLQPTVVQEEEQVSPSLQTRILHSKNV
jgi:hypothetical protein